VPLVVIPDVLPTPVFPLVDPASQLFLRHPAKSAQERGEGDQGSASTSDAPAERQRQPASADAASPATDSARELTPFRAQAERVATAVDSSVTHAERMRPAVSQKSVLRATGGDGDGRVAEGLAAPLRVIGAVPAIGALASIALATGLVAKLLAASLVSPAARLPRLLAQDKPKRVRKSATRRRGRRRPTKRAGTAQLKRKRRPT
jgi:hypothetical protein